jgi:hypothetical protein
VHTAKAHIEIQEEVEKGRDRTAQNRQGREASPEMCALRHSLVTCVFLSGSIVLSLSCMILDLSSESDSGLEMKEPIFFHDARKQRKSFWGRD